MENEIMKIKTGIWVNREKMRRALEKVSMFYGSIIMLTGMYDIFRESYTRGIFEMIMSLPLIMIFVSKMKFNKLEMEEKEDVGKKKG